MDTAVIVTERAARKINEILGRETAPSVLRVSVEGGGCSGFQYKFDIDRAAAADDLVIEREGAILVVDPVSLQYMTGSKLDFVDDLLGASFKIENPKATASCGCGTSFTLCSRTHAHRHLQRQFDRATRRAVEAMAQRAGARRRLPAGTEMRRPGVSARGVPGLSATTSPSTGRRPITASPSSRS